jgi:CHAD domain-containing protein
MIIDRQPPLTPEAPLWAWAYEAMTRRAETMLAHADGVRAGEDIEAVHDMRVASRRLAAAMRVFRECFPGRRYEALLREARRVTRRLGEVRDLDVLIEYFEGLRENVAGGALPGLEYVGVLLGRRRRRARRPMLGALAATERSDLPGRIGRFLREESQAYALGVHPGCAAPATCAEATRPFRVAAPATLEARHGAFYAFAAWAPCPEAAAQLHEMRIAAKWLRYTMELFAPAYADALKKPLAAIRRMQETLGDLHDSDVRLELLRTVVAGPLDARALVEMDVLRPQPVRESLPLLLEGEEKRRRRYYDTFYREWRKLEARGFREASLRRIREPDAPASREHA